MWSCDPGPSAIVFDVMLGSSGRAGSAPGFKPADGFLDLGPNRASKEVDFDDLLQSPAETHDTSMCLFLIARPRNFLQLSFKGLIFTGSRLIKHPLDLFVPEGVKGTYLGHCSISFRAANRGCQPFKAFLIHRIIRQNISRRR